MSHAYTTALAAPGETINLPLEIKATEGEGTAPGTFEGYGSVFGNADRDGDIVERGAFAESLKGGLPALLWQHDQKQPIGRFDIVREDKRGLFVKGRLSQTGKGLEAYELLKMGALNGLSIGFVTKEASREAVTGTRRIMRADLMEVSLVTFPANELARVASVKAHKGAQSQHKDLDVMETMEFDDEINDVRSFERLLRGNGFSRSRAKAITAKGFRVADLATDESAEIAEMVAGLKQSQGSFEGKGFSKKLSPFSLAASLVNVLRKIKRTEVNQISIMPGKSGSARIIPVSPGKVTFEVTPPPNMRDAKFDCTIRYFEFKNGTRIAPVEITLNQNRPYLEVDRGILKTLIPRVKLRDVEAYFDDVALNLTMGTTVATLDFHDYPQGHPHQIKKTRGVFKITAHNDAVEQMKLERLIEQYRRKHPDQFD